MVMALGCSTDTPAPGAAASSRATLALQALTTRDSQATARCRAAVDACQTRVVDAAPGDVCERLADRCDALEAKLAEARGPAVHCWQGVRACEEHAPDQAQCSRDATGCEALDEGAADDRSRAVECTDRVQACLTRAADLPAAALVACDNIAAACEHAAAAGAGHAGRDAGADEDDATKGDDAIDAGDDDDDDDQGEDEDDADDSDDESGRGRGPRTDRGDVTHAHGRDARSDAGTPTD